VKNARATVAAPTLVPFETASMAARMRPPPEVVSFIAVWPREAVTNLALGALYCTRSCLISATRFSS
jgi:hypothetical protein